MILVDVEVPVLEKNYDVRVDEYAPAADVLEDIVDMICQKEQIICSGELAWAAFWHKESGRMLEMGKSLRDHRIGSGQTLILA